MFYSDRKPIYNPVPTKKISASKSKTSKVSRRQNVGIVDYVYQVSTFDKKIYNLLPQYVCSLKNLQLFITSFSGRRLSATSVDEIVRTFAAGSWHQARSEETN